MTETLNNCCPCCKSNIEVVLTDKIFPYDICAVVVFCLSCGAILLLDKVSIRNVELEEIIKLRKQVVQSNDEDRDTVILDHAIKVLVAKIARRN